MNIREYITDSLERIVTESFGSSKLANIFKDRSGKVSVPRYIDNELQWDKITDDDLEEVSVEEARKLAYKKSEDNYIIWLNSSGTIIGCTIGSWRVFSVNHWRGKPEYGTAKAMSYGANMAVLVKDHGKFETRELRQARQEAKKDALALKSNAEVAKENIKRYKALLNEKRLQEINFGDVVDTVKKVTENYAELIGAVNDDVVCSDSFVETIRLLEDLEAEYQKIMEVFKTILGQFKSYESWKKYQNDDMVDWARKEIIEGVNTLQKLIDKFNDKYIP